MSAGCQYITGYTKKPLNPTKDKKPAAIFCGKEPQDVFTSYCPKHKVISDYEVEAPERAAQKAKATKAYREGQQAILATSPLAGDNPGYKSKRTKKATYQNA